MSDPTKDPRFLAAYDMLRRTGATSTQLRYSDDEEPTVWLAVATWQHDGQDFHETAGALDPVTATLRLLEQVLDGGSCTHCDRPTGVDIARSPSAMPLSELVCWYQFDPELATFRRGCEGEEPAT